VSYDRIMVGTDGSETARWAEEAAARLASASEAQLLVVAAYEDVSEVQGIVERAELRAREQGLTEVRAETQRGKPAEVLLEIADQQDADLLVLGSKGMSGGRRFLLGSVPGRVAEQSPCDLLIVRTTAEPPPGAAWGEYRKILIGTDGSSTADRATRKGLDLARRIGAEVTLLYVGFPQTGEGILAETVERLGGDGVRTLVRQGDPPDVIVDVAESEGMDLILVGNKGVGAGRFRLGSIPDKVAHYATRDVLIAKTATLALDEIPPGEGAVVARAGAKVAAFVDEDGTRHVLSAKCTHLGCTVEWNGTERTWDCPCHGSRFSHAGEVLSGPAEKALPRVEP